MSATRVRIEKKGGHIWKKRGGWAPSTEKRRKRQKKREKPTGGGLKTDWGKKTIKDKYCRKHKKREITGRKAQAASLVNLRLLPWKGEDIMRDAEEGGRKASINLGNDVGKRDRA